MAKINWDKPYSEIFGPLPVPGGKYKQGDKYFNVKGEEVKGEAAEEEKVTLPEDIEDWSDGELRTYGKRNFSLEFTRADTKGSILAKIRAQLE